MWEFSARAIRWIPTWQVLDGFQKSLCPCALYGSSLSVGRGKLFQCWGYFCSRHKMQKDIWILSKPCHVGIHWKALAEFFQMSTNNMPGLLLFSAFLHHIILTKLATSSKRVHVHAHLEHLREAHISDRYMRHFCWSDIVSYPFLTLTKKTLF